MFCCFLGLPFASQEGAFHQLVKKNARRFISFVEERIFGYVFFLFFKGLPTVLVFFKQWDYLLYFFFPRGEDCFFLGLSLSLRSET